MLRTRYNSCGHKKNCMYHEKFADSRCIDTIERLLMQAIPYGSTVRHVVTNETCLKNLQRSSKTNKIDLPFAASMSCSNRNSVDFVSSFTILPVLICSKSRCCSLFSCGAWDNDNHATVVKLDRMASERTTAAVTGIQMQS